MAYNPNLNLDWSKVNQMQSSYDMPVVSPEKPRTDWLGAAANGAGTGASVGTSVYPGWGTVIGAVVGAGAGIAGAGMKGAEEDKAYKRAQAEAEKERQQQEKLRKLQMAMQNHEDNMAGYKMFTDLVHEAIMGAR